MMILEQSDFYKITTFDSTATAVEVSLNINPKHAIFEGHFPGQPVVPGVCMLQMIKEQAEKALSKPLHLAKAAQIKYLQVLIPNQAEEVLLKIEWKDNLAFNAQLQSNGQIVMKMSGMFEYNN